MVIASFFHVLLILAVIFSSLSDLGLDFFDQVNAGRSPSFPTSLFVVLVFDRHPCFFFPMPLVRAVFWPCGQVISLPCMNFVCLIDLFLRFAFDFVPMDLVGPCIRFGGGVCVLGFFFVSFAFWGGPG